MNVMISKEFVEFRENGQTAGKYVLNDPFKPYLHPLCTPKGNVVTVAMPTDHRHHKGLMYSLRCADLNFWEEDANDCGIQEIISTEKEGENAIVQMLLWRDKCMAIARDTYDERRVISCERQGESFVWKWRSKRTALRDHVLIQSEWSSVTKNGDKINYHGLGIRLPWSFSYPPYPGYDMNAIEIDGVRSDISDALGVKAKSVAFTGGIDGKWKPDRVRVKIEQNHGFSIYVNLQNFPYMALGLSGAGEVRVKKGKVFEEEYTIFVSDAYYI